MLEVLGNRRIALCRELTKIHEEIVRGTIEEVLPLVSSMKGEFVLVVEGNINNNQYEEIDVIEHIQMYILEGMSEMEAIKKVAKERNVAKALIYREYHSKKG